MTAGGRFLQGPCWIRTPCSSGPLQSGSRSRDQLPKQALHGGAPSPAVADRPGPQNRLCAVALLASGPLDRPRRARCDRAVDQRPPARAARQDVHRGDRAAARPAHGLGAGLRPPSAGRGGGRGRRRARHLRARAGDGGRGQRELGCAARRVGQGRVVLAAGARGGGTGHARAPSAADDDRDRGDARAAVRGGRTARRPEPAPRALPPPMCAGHARVIPWRWPAIRPAVPRGAPGAGPPGLLR